MPNMWEGCVKIHEGCGGVCRWVEAINRPGVGYTGNCTACGDTNLPQEVMIPIEGITHRQLLRVAPCDTLAQLDWDDDSDWEANQERLRTIVDDLVCRPNRHANGTVATDGGDDG